MTDISAQETKYLTNSEAAAYLRLSPRTLEKHRVIGDGPRFRKFGRSVRYDIVDLISWANDRGHAKTSAVTSSFSFAQH